MMCDKSYRICAALIAIAAFMLAGCDERNAAIHEMEKGGSYPNVVFDPRDSLPITAGDIEDLRKISREYDGYTFDGKSRLAIVIQDEWHPLSGPSQDAIYVIDFGSSDIPSMVRLPPDAETLQSVDFRGNSLHIEWQTNTGTKHESKLDWNPGEQPKTQILD